MGASDRALAFRSVPCLRFVDGFLDVARRPCWTICPKSTPKVAMLSSGRYRTPNQIGGKTRPKL